MTGPTRRREAGYVAEFELDDPLDGVGTVLWRVGMVSVKERWHELVAAHVVKEDASRAELEEAEEAFALDVVANTCVWEEHGDTWSRNASGYRGRPVGSGRRSGCGAATCSRWRWRSPPRTGSGTAN
jgi:hypothetical protein